MYTNEHLACRRDRCIWTCAGSSRALRRTTRRITITGMTSTRAGPHPLHPARAAGAAGPPWRRPRALARAVLFQAHSQGHEDELLQPDGLRSDPVAHERRKLRSHGRRRMDDRAAGRHPERHRAGWRRACVLSRSSRTGTTRRARCSAWCFRRRRDGVTATREAPRCELTIANDRCLRFDQMQPPAVQQYALAARRVPRDDRRSDRPVIGDRGTRRGGFHA